MIVKLVLGRSHGLRVASVASCDSLQTIPKAALSARPIVEVPVTELVELGRALRFSLGIGR